MNFRICPVLLFFILNSACSGKKATGSVPVWEKSELVNGSIQWIPDNAETVIIFDPVTMDMAVRTKLEAIIIRIISAGNLEFSAITSATGVFRKGENILWMIKGLENKSDLWLNGFRGLKEYKYGSNKSAVKPEKNTIFYGDVNNVYHGVDVFRGTEKGSGKNWLRISKALSSLSWIKKLPSVLGIWTPENPETIVNFTTAVYFSSWFNAVGIMNLRSSSDSDRIINLIKLKVIKFARYGLYSASELTKLLAGLTVHAEGNRVYIQYTLKMSDLDILLKPALQQVIADLLGKK